MKLESISFSDLIKKYEIAIPMIQRDYAQGRKDENTEKIRDKLLGKINNADKKPIKLDFVYGYIEELDEREIFIPLDGQQRLTTLFLLHWYIAAKADKKDSTDKTNLKKFRYETRTSSTDFTQALVDNIDKLTIPSLLPAEEDKKSRKNATALSEAIKNSAWFFTSWENDPTIAAMLIMLDAIHERNITKNKLDKITFDFINMGDFKLSDDLYLKMNARGVQLTLFENFKAFFERHLEKVDEKLKNDEENSLKKRFSDSIDNKWLDIFWKLEYTEPDVTDKSYRTIDRPFMRFFWYITEMLYFKCNENTNKNIPNEIKSLNYNTDSLHETLIETVYATEYEIKYLFDTLDKFGKIRDSCTDVLSSKYEIGKVALFTTESNLLEKLVKKGQLTNTERLILFTIMNYVHENLHENSPKNHLHDLVRVVRNLLSKGTAFNHNIKKERFYKATETIFYLTEKLKETNSDSIYKLLQSIVDEKLSTYDNIPLNSTQKTLIQDEKRKAQLIHEYPKIRKVIFELEDDSRIKGAIHNFMPENNLNEISENLEKRKQAFNETWSNSWSNIVRGFLAVTDYRIYVGGSSNLGGLWSLGNNADWLPILTQYRGDNHNDFLINFLDKYGNSIEGIIDEYLQTTPEKNWRYYFVKYQQMSCAKGYWNAFAWQDGDGFKIQDFEGRYATKSHINPYARTVIAILKERHKETINKCVDESKTAAAGIQENPLWLKDGIKLFCEKSCWKLEIDNKESAYKDMSLIDCWCITMLPNVYVEDDKVLLKPTKDKDMIEIAVEFISELYQLENLPEQKKSEISSDFTTVS